MTPNRFPTACVEFKTKQTLQKLHERPSFYWAHVLYHTLRGIPELKLNPLRGVILAGSPGNGRHTIAEAIAGTLKEASTQKEKDSFLAVRIAGIALDTEDVADACTAIDGAVARLRQHGAICLLLDCPEDSRHSLAIQEYLRQQIERYPASIFPVIITESVANITPALQAILTPCQFQSPDLNARQKWLQANMEGSLPINIKGTMTYIKLAEKTNGFTWRQMTNLLILLRRTLALKYFENPQIFEAVGPREKLLTNGTIKLDQNEVLAALEGIRLQNIPAVTSVAAAPVQYVAAAATMAAPAAQTTETAAATTTTKSTPAPASKTQETSAPVSSEKTMTEEEKEDIMKAIEFHSKPQEMSFADLTNIDDL